MRRADRGILSGAHLVGGGDHKAQIEGEVEEAHVPGLEPPRVQAHRVRAHLDEECEVALDDVRATVRAGARARARVRVSVKVRVKC